MVAVLLLNIPDAPEPGAVNVTFTLETGLLPASLTVTASGIANAVLIVADCGVVPAFAVIEAAAPAVVLIAADRVAIADRSATGSLCSALALTCQATTPRTATHST